MTVSTYLNFPGNTETAFNFYKSIFGGEFQTFQRFKDMPDTSQVPPAVLDQIMHVALPLAPGYLLMGTDAPAEMGFNVQIGNNSYIALAPDSKEQATKLFNGLAEGGKIEMPLEDTFWGAYYGSLTDKFGIKWMVNFTK